MSKLLINGPSRIEGTVTPGGNKNAVLPMIAAAVLTDQEVILHNVPDILDVRNMLAVAETIGVTIKREKTADTVILKADTLSTTDIPPELCNRTRTSLLFAGPLTARFGHATLGIPGGDVIGRRRLDPHFYGLKKLGLDVETAPAAFCFARQGKLEGAEMFLDEASVTATEHIMTAAVLATGKTILRNAACEPHVFQLAELLNKMGAKITGAGTNIIEIEGVPSLHGAEITVESDYVEAASFLSLAAATGGRIEITGSISPHNYWMTRRIFEKFSCSFTVRPGLLSFAATGNLQIVPDFNNAIPCISDGPWPQFPSDMMSCIVAMATQATGTVLFFEKMFESRLFFVDKLNAMGASAIICDPHRVVIAGPARLHGIEMSSPDIRAGMAMVVAACSAYGRSSIANIDMVKRGYSDLTLKLQSLGVDCQEIAGN